MPIVQHSRLPTFERLRASGHEVLTLERALHQDIRELHIGLLNMMPDKALAATERQFFRLIGESNPIAQFYVHPFTLPGLQRGAVAQRQETGRHDVVAQDHAAQLVQITFRIRSHAHDLGGAVRA